MENPVKMDDLGDPPLFLETPICWSNRMFPDDFTLWCLGFVTKLGSPNPGPLPDGIGADSKPTLLLVLEFNINILYMYLYATYMLHTFS